MQASSTARAILIAVALGVATLGTTAVVACSNACCPIDPRPGCCMRFGGHGSCGASCDGMPLPDDPGWKIEQDELGCDVWVNHSTKPKLCGSDRGRCCPADLTPGCCMNYGGWSETGDCARVCDGMLLPNDPSWVKTVDSHGCSLWRSGFSGPTCGAVDAGRARDAADASSD